MKKAFVPLMVITSILFLVFSSCEDKEEENQHSVDNSTGDWVDLGLPSGLLWHKHDLGSYAWGDTTPAYSGRNDWRFYPHCNGDKSKLTKYCNQSSYGFNGFTDNLTTLQEEDDVATIKLGKGVHIPTKEEWQELLDNCTWYYNQGGDYIRFTGPNDNSIDFTVKGLKRAYVQGYVNDQITRSSAYWTSNLKTDRPDCARCFVFKFIMYEGGPVEDYFVNFSDKQRCGFCYVRPVRHVR